MGIKKVSIKNEKEKAFLMWLNIANVFLKVFNTVQWLAPLILVIINICKMISRDSVLKNGKLWH